MEKVYVLSPWETYRKKLIALFEQDEDIFIDEIEECDDMDAVADYTLDIKVYRPCKYLALDRVLKKTVKFGNETMVIKLDNVLNSSNEDERIEVLKKVFEGNRIVKDFKDVVDQTGTHHSYVRFQPEVCQFYDDNLADYNGNWTGLAQDIAYEVFDLPYGAGLYFCTADKREDEAVETAEEPKK